MLSKALELMIALVIFCRLCACAVVEHLRSRFFRKPRRNFTVKIVQLYHKVTYKEFKGIQTLFEEKNL